MVGKGSVNHNSRKFKAENVDGSRTHLNIDYCNENIKTVYRKMFDEALKRYNDKQTRADRKIENYYEKIRNSKQEKPFHELILQIGDKENMSAESENGQLAREVLDEYYRGFQERNPQLKVFSAHLHMDEATPHLHIDFVPFTTGSKRGLDTRVSLKQALAAQGFQGRNSWRYRVESMGKRRKICTRISLWNATELSGNTRVLTKNICLFWITKSMSEKRKSLYWTINLPRKKTSFLLWLTALKTLITAKERYKILMKA